MALECMIFLFYLRLFHMVAWSVFWYPELSQVSTKLIYRRMHAWLSSHLVGTFSLHIHVKLLTSLISPRNRRPHSGRCSGPWANPFLVWKWCYVRPAYVCYRLWFSEISADTRKPLISGSMKDGQHTWSGFFSNSSIRRHTAGSLTW